MVKMILSIVDTYGSQQRVVYLISGCGDADLERYSNSDLPPLRWWNKYRACFG